MSVAELQKTIRGLSAEDRRALAQVVARMHGPKRRAPRLLLKRHPVSGLTYNAAAGRKATLVEIEAALADFP